MDIYQHFRKEEAPFIDKVISWKEQVEQRYVPKLTDFLDPREKKIIEMVIGNDSDIKIVAFGGSPHSERKRVIIAPYYEEIAEKDFQLTLLQASYPEKFITIEHRDVLGAFLSLGMKRNKIGDIFVGDGMIQFITAEETGTYVLTNLNSIKKANIQLSSKPVSEFKLKETKWVEMDRTVSSLRLDAIIKEIHQISRKDASDYIRRLLVKVNFKVTDQTNFIVQEGDLFSVRGKGRSKLVKINGKTKKDKWKITIAKMI